MDLMGLFKSITSTNILIKFSKDYILKGIAEIYILVLLKKKIYYLNN